MRLRKPWITVLHLLVLCFIYASPFIVPLRWIVVLAALYFLQIRILGGCILTKMEFGSYDDSANWRYLSWLGHWFGLRFKKERVDFVVNYVVPPLILLAAFLYQKFGRCWLC